MALQILFKREDNTKLIHWPLLLIALIAGIYFVWQLIGLRYTNHDDIYFNLYSSVFSGNYLDFADFVAKEQARLQAYINIPIILWINRFNDSGWFDMLNIGSFGIFYLSLLWLLAKMGGLRNALAIGVMTLLFFPLHYYFTFPQGYPLMFSWALACAFISAGFLFSYLEKPVLWKYALSVFLFIGSLCGSEYNFVLHPLLLVIVFWVQKERTLKFRQVMVPYILSWVIIVSTYLLFSIFARDQGADSIGRVSFGFNMISFLKTFLILQQKAFLPTALFQGIGLTSAVAQGSPDIPGVLTFSSLWTVVDWKSMIVVFLLACVACSVALHSQKLSDTLSRRYIVLFLFITILPTWILSLSSLYQDIVIKGYIQGHLTTFYSQLGFAAFLFLALAFGYNKCLKGSLLKRGVFGLSIAILASFSTLTFVYNTVNRQVMNANGQKWMAMKTLTQYLIAKPEQLKKNFYAADFWSWSGVSVIPEDSLPGLNSQNYWSEYSRSAFNVAANIVKSNTNFVGDMAGVLVKYFSTPSGVPLLILNERMGEESWRITAVASKSVRGVIEYGRDNNGQKKQAKLDQWICNTTHCMCTWREERFLDPENISFIPVDKGPQSLIAQFMIGRNGQYALLKNTSNMRESIE